MVRNYLATTLTIIDEEGGNHEGAKEFVDEDEDGLVECVLQVLSGALPDHI